MGKSFCSSNAKSLAALKTLCCLLYRERTKDLPVLMKRRFVHQELLRKEKQNRCNQYRPAKGQPRPLPARIPIAKKHLPVDHECGTHTSVWQIGQVMYVQYSTQLHNDPIV